jgi:hypothetical protein
MSMASVNQSGSAAVVLDFRPGALVVEAAEGVWRTVMALRDRNDWYLALPENNPLCAALSGTPRIRVMEADGRAFSVRPQDASQDLLAARVISLVQERGSALRHAQGTPRLFRLALDVVLGQEPGQAPRT